MEGAPPLRVSEHAGRVRLALDGFAHVEGATLQDAGDALVARLLEIAMAIRASGVAPVYAGGCPDVALLDFVLRLGDHAAAGGDPRDVLFAA